MVLSGGNTAFIHSDLYIYRAKRPSTIHSFTRDYLVALRLERAESIDLCLIFRHLCWPSHNKERSALICTPRLTRSVQVRYDFKAEFLIEPLSSHTGLDVGRQAKRIRFLCPVLHESASNTFAFGSRNLQREAVRIGMRRPVQILASSLQPFPRKLPGNSGPCWGRTRESHYEPSEAKLSLHPRAGL